MKKICCILILITLYNTKTLFPKKFLLYKSIKPEFIPIGIAPRSYAKIAAGYIYFTEKSRPPKNYAPGTVYRVLYRIKLKSKNSERLAVLGNVKSNPFIDIKNKRIFFTKRTQDTNKDQIISNSDNRIVCKISLNGNSYKELSNKKNDTTLLANNKKELLVKSKHHLRLINPKKITSKKIASIKQRIHHAFYDKKNKLFIINNSKQFNKIKNKKIIKSKKPALIYKDDKIKIYTYKKHNNYKYIKKYNNKLVYNFTAKKLHYLFPINKQKDLFADYNPNTQKIFIGKPSSKTFQIIYRFPSNTTKINFSNNNIQCVFLTTFDSDNNGIFEPDSLDKSAIFFIEIAKKL